MIQVAGRPVQVVGSGVVGLSCAVRLAEAGYPVQVLTRDPPAATTSAVAGGLWLPYRAEPAQRVAAWGRATLAHLMALAEDPEAGVALREGVLLHHDVPPRPPWADEVADLAPVRQVGGPAPGYRHGLQLRVPVVDMPQYLTYLQSRLRRAGGQLTRTTLSALPERGLVVNAAGLGARTLAGDPTVYPVRGQIVLLANPGLTRWFVDEHESDGELTYVLPRRHDVVVGGSATEHDWDEAVDTELARRILDRACRMVPQLRAARLLAHRVGLRPARPRVRLDGQRRPGGALVHCYGHGGAGVTLSWGCAGEVLTLLRQLG